MLTKHFDIVEVFLLIRAGTDIALIGFLLLKKKIIIIIKN